MKKLISGVLLATVLLLTVSPVSASTSSWDCEGTIHDKIRHCYG
jgi:hypothetical protein